MSRRVRLLFLLIGVGIVALMIWKTGPAVLWAGLRGSGWVLPALVPLWCVIYLLNALAWRLLTSDDGPALPLGRAFLMTIMAFAVNYSTPLMSFGGEPLKVMVSTPVLGRSRAVGSIVAFRLLHALAHVILFLVAMIPTAFIIPGTPLATGIFVATALVLGLIAWFLVSRHREGLAMHLLALLRRLPLLKRLAARLEPRAAALHEIDQNITAVYQRAPGRYYGALVLEMLARLLVLAEMWIILRGMHLDVTLWNAVVIASFASLVVNILIFLPLELGAKEGSLFVILGWMGMTPGLGLAAALLARLRELIWIAIGWGLIWLAK